MSGKEFGNNPSPEKEDAVREALGVEKKFKVRMEIPTTGTVTMGEIVVMALNEDEAKEKAIELINNGEADIEGEEAEEYNHDYGYEEDTTKWAADIDPAE